MTTTTKMIDPPGGWQYGFPKPYTPLPGETLVEWLVREGYPAVEAEWAINHLRYWETDGVLQSPVQPRPAMPAQTVPYLNRRLQFYVDLRKILNRLASDEDKIHDIATILDPLLQYAFSTGWAQGYDYRAKH